MTDLAYESFLSGDKVIDASFIYMLVLMGIVLLVIGIFKLVAKISDKNKK